MLLDFLSVLELFRLVEAVGGLFEVCAQISEAGEIAITSQTLLNTVLILDFALFLYVAMLFHILHMLPFLLQFESCLFDEV